MLQAFLGHLQGALLLEKIEVGKDTENIARHTAGRQSVQKFHSLHLESIVSINHQKNDICDLGHVDHGCEGVGRTFHKGEALLLRGDNSQRALGGAECLLGIAADQRLDEGGLANLE